MVEKDVKDGTNYDIHHGGKQKELHVTDALVVIEKVITLAGKALVIKAEERATGHERDRQHLRELGNSNDGAGEGKAPVECQGTSVKGQEEPEHHRGL
jgi:hypothetical protein